MDQSIRKVIFFVCTTLVLLGYPGPAAADKITLVFGGDIQWPESNAEAAGIFFHPRPQLWDRALARVPGRHYEGMRGILCSRVRLAGALCRLGGPHRTAMALIQH